jgi:pimeloyl-ACP methyl ester carboxylesterase
VPVPLPSTPVGDHLRWMLESLRDGARDLTSGTVGARFSDAFMDLVPADQIVGSMQEFSATLRDFSFDGFTRQPTDRQLIALLTASDGNHWVMPIAVEPNPPHRITGIGFSPVPVPPGIALVPYTEPGTHRVDGLYDIGDGRRMYLSCVGDGGPTVILESGLGDSAAPWFGIESAVSRFARVCTYDRPGSIGGASDPSGAPHVGADAIADLRALLHATGIPGPYILVGHSVGGVFARLFAHTWPDDVDGLVLVDASHEDQIPRIRNVVPPDLWAQMERFMVPAPSLTPEGVDVPATFEEVRTARIAAPLPNIPLVVVSAGIGRDPAIFPDGWPIVEDHAVWLEMQEDLATLVPNGRHVIAARSSHYVHQTEPELVIDAIRDVIQAVRDGADLRDDAQPREGAAGIL